MRIVQTDRWGTYIRDLQPLGAVTRTRDLDGTDQLELTVQTDADKGDRIMAVDTMGRVCEWEVSSIDAVRESSAPALDLVCVAGYGELSLAWIDEKQNTDYSAAACLEKALDGTRWEVGTCESGTLNSTATTSWYHESVSDALEEICDTYGLELEASYELDSTGTSIAARYINLYEQRGSDNGKRFTYGKDLTGIRRTIGSTRPITRCYGYGKGVEITDEETGETTGGYSRKIDFADVNDGLEYVDAGDDYLALWGVPGPDGDILPAVGIYENGDCEDEEQLLAETIAYLAEACEPTVSYTCDVAALGIAGMDAEGVDIGDTVQIVDTTFPTPLRLSGRVTQLVEDLRDGAGATTVTLGSVVESYAARQASIEQALETVRSNSAAWSSAAAGTNTYISDLIARINELMNATGGYVYLVEGEGIYVYDYPVDESPTQCIHIGGGFWRCANSKTSAGEWDWQTMADGSGLYAGALYTGILSDAAGENWWNLDTGELSISAGSTIGDYTVSELTVAVEGISASVESVTEVLESDYTTTSALSELLDEYATKSALEEVDEKADAANATAESAYAAATALLGTCATAASTAAKVVVCEDFALFDGAAIAVTFTYANTAGAITLNVNGTGALSVYVSGGTASTSNYLLWSAGTTVEFVYDGTYWLYAGGATSYKVTCGTAAATAAKTATQAGAVVCKGTNAVVTWTYGSSYEGAITFNLGSTADKTVYYGNAATSSTNVLEINATETFELVFSGAYWYVADSASLTRNATLAVTVDEIDASVSEVYETTGYTLAEIADLAITAESITSTVSSTYATVDSLSDYATVDYVDEGDDVTIGGRNLLPDTRDMSTWANASTYVTETDDEGYGIAVFPEADSRSWRSVVSRGYGTSSEVLPYSLVRGKTVTFSVDVMVPGGEVGTGASAAPYIVPFVTSGTSDMDRDVYKDIYATDIESLWGISADADDLAGWQRATYTLDLTDSSFTSGSIDEFSDDCGFGIALYAYTTYEVRYRKPKLELGDVATDWTPAPEDAETYTDDAVSTATTTITAAYTSAIEQTANSITSSVTETLGDYVTSSELEQTANSLTATFESGTYGRNLFPGFSLPAEDGDWLRLYGTWTFDGDGWATLTYDNTDGSSTYYCSFFQPPIETLDTDATYTVLTEVKDCTVSGSVVVYGVSYHETSYPGQFATQYGHALTTGTETSYYDVDTTISDFSDCATSLRSFVSVAAGGSVTVSVRVSLYEGEYSGPYNTYIDSYSHSTVIRQSGNGVEVGLYEDGSYTGSRTQMNETGFYVLNSSGSVHAAMNTGGIYFLPNGTSAANIQSTHLALGYSAVAAGTNAVAIGASSNASAANSMALGVGAVASGNDCMAFGKSAVAGNTRSIAMGYGANSNGYGYTIAIGYGATSSNRSVALGYNSVASGINTIALGMTATASGTAASALGRNSTASGEGATALGYGSTASGNYGSALCYGSVASGSNSLALGYASNASADNSTALGRSATANVAGATALGYNATASSNNGIAIGFSSIAGYYGVAIGPGAVTSNNQAVAVGYAAYAKTNGSVAVGILSNVYGDCGVAVGYNACAGTSVAGYTVAVGSAVRATGNYGVAIGGIAQASANLTTAVGFNAIASQAYGTAIGHQAAAWGGANATALGTGASATVNSTALGRSAQATGSRSTAVGFSAVCANTNGVQLGNASYTSTLTCKVSLTTTSDERDKADLEEVPDGATEFLRAVTAYTFVFNQRETYHYPEDELTDEQLELRHTYGLYAYDTEAWAAGTLKGERRRVGVSAQEVQAALESVYGSADFANLVNDNLHDFEEVPDDVESQLAVNYEGFVPFLIKAFQELDARVTALEGGS